MPGSLVFKQADTASEFEQIHRLNYRTFAEEVGQYAADGTGLLVDRFHHKNTYYVAVEDGKVLGMVAAHDEPPYSVETRLADANVLNSLEGPLLEVRLLALEPGSRHRMILGGLLWEMYCDARERGYGHLIVSGISDKASMYRRIGFRPLGPAVTSGGATFIPMALPLDRPSEHLAWYVNSYLSREARLSVRPSVSLMPGPVEIAPVVRRAFTKRPVSHRSAEFLRAYEGVRSTLRDLSGGMNVAMMVGSGTTANDTVAMHLRRAFGNTPGLVLVNGEFGERISRQASRAGLRFDDVRWRWGQPWDLNHVAAALSRGAAWIWAVHLETSTGVLNRLPELIDLAARRGVSVAADCVSSIGAVPLPSHGLWMSTGVSGKALGAYPGLAFVFASSEALEQVSGTDLPACMDVKAAAECSGPQFTVASPLVLALQSALVPYRTAESADRRFAKHEEIGRKVRAQLKRLDMTPLAHESDAAPCVTTFTLPEEGFIEKCRRAGFELGGESGYLRDRGWTQIATMGAVDTSDLDRLFGLLERKRELAFAAASRNGH